MLSARIAILASLLAALPLACGDDDGDTQTQPDARDSTRAETDLDDDPNLTDASADGGGADLADPTEMDSTEEHDVAADDMGDGNRDVGGVEDTEETVDVPAMDLASDVFGSTQPLQPQAVPRLRGHRRVQVEPTIPGAQGAEPLAARLTRDGPESQWALARSRSERGSALHRCAVAGS